MISIMKPRKCRLCRDFSFTPEYLCPTTILLDVIFVFSEIKYLWKVLNQRLVSNGQYLRSKLFIKKYQQITVSAHDEK